LIRRGASENRGAGGGGVDRASGAGYIRLAAPDRGAAHCEGRQMTTSNSRVTVGVFDLPERADRAVAELLRDGCTEDQVATIEGPADGVAAELTGAGVAAELAAYYEGEVRAGRRLVAVRCDPGHSGPVMSAFGRNGGSVRVPAAVREGPHLISLTPLPPRRRNSANRRAIPCPSTRSTTQHPADVNPLWVAAVVEDVGAVTPRVLKGVGEDRHGAKVARLVHLRRERDSGVGAPFRMEVYRPERVTYDVAEEVWYARQPLPVLRIRESLARLTDRVPNVLLASHPLGRLAQAVLVMAYGVTAPNTSAGTAHSVHVLLAAWRARLRAAFVQRPSAYASAVSTAARPASPSSTSHARRMQRASEQPQLPVARPDRSETLNIPLHIFFLGW
jgi:hypothetical protein